MIRRATIEDRARLETLFGNTPCMGPRLEADWRLFMQNAAMPYQFFLAGDGCVIEWNGRGFFMIGAPPDETEIELFLAFHKATRLMSDGWVPRHWQKEEFILMRKTPGFCACRKTLEPDWFDACPPAEDVIQVLESSDGQIMPSESRDGFYRDICARRNHGLAAIYGIWERGVLVSTAGVYALAKKEAYIACVETRPQARGKGYASILVHRLCEEYISKKKTLMCHKNLRDFYIPLGFKKIDGRTGIMATASWRPNINL